MNNKHRRTLATIFEDPVRPDVLWSDIEALFRALEKATVQERAGSRVAIHLNGAVAVFHRPHPEKVTDKGALKAVRRFLLNAGVRP